MKVGYQGEQHSYSFQAVRDVFPAAQPVGFPSFAAAFEALATGSVERLVLPIENSTTGSVLPVLDRLVAAPAAIVAEHLVEVRHAILGIPGTPLPLVKRVLSHAEALSQAEEQLLARGWEPVPVHDTAGAVRRVAEDGNPAQVALAPQRAAEVHGLEVLLTDVIDRQHNTTRFVVLEPGDPQVDPDDDKTSIMFETAHQPGALALALSELGLRGANLTRIESRPGEEPWSYRFHVDLVHEPGPEGLARVIDPPPATLAHLIVLGSYRAVPLGSDDRG
jgi:prephenate dehydratase